MTRKKSGHLGGGSGVRLFLRLNADLNERLRALLRYQGELSRYIDEALVALQLNPGFGLYAPNVALKTRIS